MKSETGWAPPLSSMTPGRVTKNKERPARTVTQADSIQAESSDVSNCQMQKPNDGEGHTGHNHPQLLGVQAQRSKV